MSKRKESGSDFAVCRDHQGRTCLMVYKNEGVVKYIPMCVDTGFEVSETSVGSFEHRYSVMPDYPVDKGCQLYLNYALALGASDEVLDFLSQVTTISKEDREMATSKKKSLFDDTEKKKKTEKVPVDKTEKPTKLVVKKNPVEPPAKKPAKKVKSKDGEYSSAAQMFQGLIMGGKLTDDEIFSQVQEAFWLDDKKRSYVKWYRNNLIKKGENPPEAK